MTNPHLAFGGVKSHDDVNHVQTGVNQLLIKHSPQENTQCLTREGGREGGRKGWRKEREGETERGGIERGREGGRDGGI